MFPAPSVDVLNEVLNVMQCFEVKCTDPGLRRSGIAASAELAIVLRESQCKGWPNAVIYRC